jgi:outer membrane protein OmpA-like peptidoglycan-associated protein
MDGFADEDGCPDPDDDEDGVSDLLDACDREAEDRDGWQDADGCLDADDDDDGLLDTEDTCPRAPGGRASDGCPTTLRIEGESIVLVRELDFAAGEATLVPSNGPLLDELSAVMLLDTAGHRWRIVVRASGGRRDDGRALAQARAEAIVRSLVGRGVAPEALEAAVGNPRDDDYVRIETLPAAS